MVGKLKTNDRNSEKSAFSEALDAFLMVASHQFAGCCAVS